MKSVSKTIKERNGARDRGAGVGAVTREGPSEAVLLETKYESKRKGLSRSGGGALSGALRPHWVQPVRVSSVGLGTARAWAGAQEERQPCCRKQAPDLGRSGVAVNKTHSDPGWRRHMHLEFCLGETLEPKFSSIKWGTVAPEWAI